MKSPKRNTLRHRARFAVAVPAKSPRLPDLQRTVESILGQYALRDGYCEVGVTVVLSDAGPDVESWLLRHESSQLVVVRDEGLGLYEALRLGLEHQDADFFGYLGVGDTYELQAFTLLVENFELEPLDAWWATGMIIGRRADGAIVRCLLPFRYRRRFFQAGIHGTLLPTVQQESTFWNAGLHKLIDWSRVTSQRLAGDFELWRQFSKRVEPVVIEAALGSFIWHDDNMSSNYEEYRAEVQSLTTPPSVVLRAAAKLDKVGWALPNRLKVRMSRGRVHRYVWPSGPWVQR